MKIYYSYSAFNKRERRKHIIMKVRSVKIRGSGSSSCMKKMSDAAVMDVPKSAAAETASDVTYTGR